jgi:hypothetical protein
MITINKKYQKFAFWGKSMLYLVVTPDHLVLLFLGGIFYEKRQDGLDWNPIIGWSYCTI